MSLTHHAGHHPELATYSPGLTSNFSLKNDFQLSLTANIIHLEERRSKTKAIEHKPGRF
jgi:hypothetical protein